MSFSKWKLPIDMRKTVVDFLRHGEPQGGNVYRGQQDDELTLLGWQQMQRHLVDKPPWQTILTSPLKRCAAFADHIRQECNIDVHHQKDLQEIHFGQWQGLTAEQIEANDKAGFFAFYDDPLNNTPPLAESLEAFQQRCLSAWQQVLVQHQGEHSLVITHAGVIRIILVHVLSMPLTALFQIDVPFACLSRIEVQTTDKGHFSRLMFHAGQL